MRAIFLGFAKEDSQSEPPEWYANLAALFFTRSKVLILHSLYGFQKAATYSRMGRTSDL